MAINQPSGNLPLADLLRAVNEMVAAKPIQDRALGGALAAIYYVEPFTTCDANSFFIPADKGLTAGVPVYAHLQAAGRSSVNISSFVDFPSNSSPPMA